MLIHARVPTEFWAEAVVHAADIRNRFHCPRNRKKTSYEVMVGRVPRVDHVKVFRCTAWLHIPRNKRKKLERKSEKGVVIGCYENSLYKLWIGSRKKAVFARHVKIFEKQFQNRDWYGISSQNTEDLYEDDDESEESTVQPQFRAEIRSVERPSRRVQIADQETVQQANPPVSHDILTHIPLTPSSHRAEDTVQPEVERHAPEGVEPDESENDTAEEGEGNRYPQRSRKQTTFFSPGALMAFSAIEDQPFATVSQVLEQVDGRNWKNAIGSELLSTATPAIAQEP